jgi:hypothetical protein
MAGSSTAMTTPSRRQYPEGLTQRTPLGRVDAMRMVIRGVAALVILVAAYWD